MTQPSVTRAYRIAAMLTATSCFALNYIAWSLVRPTGDDPWHSTDLGLGANVLLMSVPAVLGALGRIPVGALADRFGPRIMFPAVGSASALVLLLLATADSRPVMVAAACALGVAGTAFPVGAPLVASLYPLGKRGLGLSVYGAGVLGVAAGNLASLQVVRAFETSELMVLAAALLGCSVLAAMVIRGGPAVPGPREHLLRTAVALVRLPATRYLAAWFAVAVGGLASFTLYLPFYLQAVHGMGRTSALLNTAAAVAVVAAVCPVGGWLSGRRSAAGLLALCYLTVAVLGLAVVFAPPKNIVISLVIAMAAGLGVAFGVILALIARTAPAGGVGIITGTVSAAGGLAALLAPMLLLVAYERTGSFGIGWALLAGLTMAAAAHIHGQRGYVGAVLAFPAPPPADGHATTVVSLAATDAARNTEGVVAALAALATPGDLAIVYGAGAVAGAGAAPGGPGMAPYALVSGLRTHLPGRVVVTAYLNEQLGNGESRLVADVLDEGGVALVYAPRADLASLAARLANRLGAHQVLRLTDQSIDGSRSLRLPWLIHPLVTTVGNGRSG